MKVNLEKYIDSNLKIFSDDVNSNVSGIDMDLNDYHRSKGIKGHHIKSFQDMVHDLEEIKGFGHDIRDKIIWMGEEYGELCHAFKHNETDKIIEESVDVIFFALSIISACKGDAYLTFLRKMRKNMNRVPVKTEKEFHFDKE